jgi:hypothetical protein
MHLNLMFLLLVASWTSAVAFVAYWYATGVAESRAHGQVVTLRHQLDDAQVLIDHLAGRK